MPVPAATGAANPMTRLTALEQRLVQAATALGVDAGAPLSEPGDLAHVLLDRLVGHIAQDVHDDAVWLLLVAVCGAFPVPDDVVATRRSIRSLSRDGATVALLVLARASGGAGSSSTMRVVDDQPVVDVDFSARHDLHTGIQRVVRETLPRWERAHPLTMVAWNEDGTGMRPLDAVETDRVLRFSHAARPASRPARSRPEDRLLVVPWRTTVVLPEVPRGLLADRLRALTAANQVSAVGYDCIPVVSADTLPAAEPVKFVRYLSLLKHVDRVAAISEASAEEFAGFCDMLPTQGLRGPDVGVCVLPVEVQAPAGTHPGLPPGPPQVLAVGSHDPRKNHLSLLHAADRLWREGLEFSLVLVGGKGWRSEAFDAEVRRLARQGRAVRSARGVGDAELWGLYDRSRFSVFPSLHEGYGLPVAESLARGVPTLTSARGSTAEIAKGGGALTVDPMDDEALLEAMRRMLVDDDLIERLRHEARSRHPRTWDDYAAELWSSLVPAASS